MTNSEERKTNGGHSMNIDTQNGVSLNLNSLKDLIKNQKRLRMCFYTIIFDTTFVRKIDFENIIVSSLYSKYFWFKKYVQHRRSIRFI